MWYSQPPPQNRQAKLRPEIALVWPGEQVASRRFGQHQYFMFARTKATATSTDCRMQPPADLRTPVADSTHHRRSKGYWNSQTLASLRHAKDSGELFAPVQPAPPDGWADAIRASQFPSECGRMLLIEDDIAGQGLGMTAELMTFALLIAMKHGRVLLEVALDPNWGRTNTSVPYRAATAGPTTPIRPATRPRWCSRPPFTHQCFYRPWSHCAAGNTSEHVSPKLGRWNGLPDFNPIRAAWPRYVRLKLSSLAVTTPLYRDKSGKSSTAVVAGMQFLFHPRAWVEQVGRCLMHRDHLRTGKFISVHIRHSKEKNSEAIKHGHVMPPVESYATSTAALSHMLRLQGYVHLQTSSAEALASFRQLLTSEGSDATVGAPSHARSKPLALSYTDNPRSEHDTWGGWEATASKDETVDGMVAAVNAFVSTHAAALISPRISSWTSFLAHLARGPMPQSNGSAALGAVTTVAAGGGPLVLHLCCACGRRDLGSNLVVAVSAAVPWPTQLLALRNSTKCPLGVMAPI